MKSVIRIGNNEVLQFVTENLVITGVNGRNHGRTDGQTDERNRRKLNTPLA